MSVLLALWIVGVMPISARPRAKRIVMIALDGISVPGFTTRVVNDKAPWANKLSTVGAGLACPNQPHKQP